MVSIRDRAPQDSLFTGDSTENEATA